ncbi:MAG TPA: hypothetical protein VGP08_10115 [Pyrinomonadaceae bacterium]|jgi:hypothetical protein|nr:hypothetical protein [Pyrinomonadaceae bacterium]
MCVGSKKFTLVLLLAAALLLPSVASAQNSSASSDWAALNTVTSGSKLVVKTKDGRSYEGRLSGVSDAALSLSVKDKPVELKREDVQSVYRIGKNSATKATLIGMGVGAGAGAAIGVAADSSSDGFEKIDHAVTAGLTVVGAGVGALTGYLIGRGGSKRTLIYEAARP